MVYAIVIFELVMVLGCCLGYGIHNRINEKKEDQAVLLRMKQYGLKD